MNKRVLTLINDTESSYLLTEQEHKWYEKNLTNEAKRVVSLVEERGVYGFKYGSIMKDICNFISSSLSLNTPVAHGTYKGVYPMHQYNIKIPCSILKNIDIFERLSIEINIWNIITNDDIEDKLYGQGTGSYSVSAYDRLTLNGKLPSSTIKVGGFAINGKVVEHTIVTSLYHEINHAADNYNRLKRYGNLGLYDAYIDRNYIDIIDLMRSNDATEESIGTVAYRLWVPSEKNALITSVYTDLKSMKSLRSNFIRDMQRTKAYKTYQEIKTIYLPKIANINVSNIEKYKSILQLPVSIKTKEAFVEYFTKKTNFLLGDLLKRIGKTATLYYDENEEVRDKNNTVKKRYNKKTLNI